MRVGALLRYISYLLSKSWWGVEYFFWDCKVCRGINIHRVLGSDVLTAERLKTFEAFTNDAHCSISIKNAYGRTCFWKNCISLCFESQKQRKKNSWIPRLPFLSCKIKLAGPYGWCLKRTVYEFFSLLLPLKVDYSHLSIISTVTIISTGLHFSKMSLL